MVKTVLAKFHNNIKIDRNELSGAFGDIGTDLPLIIGVLLISGLDPVSVFIMFGLTQIFSGLFYGIPMPVQPLKAVAIMAISMNLDGSLILAAGVSLGVVMLVLNITGLIKYIYNIVPDCVIRGIQFGLGINLLLLAILKYIPSMGVDGLILSAVAFSIVFLLLGNRRFPAALAVILVGVSYSIFFNPDSFGEFAGFHIPLPELYTPTLKDLVAGFLILGIPQLPLSISNSIVATKKLSDDLFPKKELSIKKLAGTYSFVNIVNPLLGGLPVCHGSGGLAGHYAFGGRTGGTLAIYGLLFIGLAIVFAGDYGSIQALFPLPILGVILSVEGFSLTKFIRKTAGAKELIIALLVGGLCITVNGGYAYALAFGTIVYYFEPIIRRSINTQYEN